MSHRTIVYGRILGPTWKSEDYYRLHRKNCEILSSVVDEDTEYPWINKSMFSVSNSQGVFRDQVISYSASYKSLEWEWHLWLEKFEQYLQLLFFYDATIHVEFEVLGEFTYKWKTDLEKAKLLWFQDIPNPNVSWVFESDGARTFED